MKDINPLKKLLVVGQLLLYTLLSVAQPLTEGYTNPVIGGFHPDPSICRAGEDFYLVNSSFQYFPGVPLFHSRDLVNWEQIGNVLDRASQLPLQGSSSWLGIYAPTIRYHEGLFYMITTNVGNGGNFLVTASDPRGPWSEPVWLEQEGIDPSLYFEDGKCYMTSNPGNCIWLCEIDPQTGKQLTPSKPLWSGTGGRYPEGPHIYKKDGYYYLLISEGGTELAHSLTIARSRDIYGPYQPCPDNPILTHCSMKGQDKQIQGTGHGDLVQATDGSWWMVFLAYRNFGGSYHHLGRETFLAPVEWAEGEWPVVNNGMPVDTLMSVPTLPRQKVALKERECRFEKPLSAEWVHLQNPIEANYRQTEGRMRLYGASPLKENNRPTFLGIRQESPVISIETEVDRRNLGEGACAGLSVYQIHDGHAELFVDREAVALRCQLKALEAEMARLPLPQQGEENIRLCIDSDGTMYRFSCITADGTRHDLGVLNCSLLSTEVVGGFTGVTIGMFAEGEGYADFHYFKK